MGTHPIFESDFDCLTDMNKLPPIQGQSTLKQLEQIANTTVDQTNYAGDQSTVSAPPGQSETQKKPRRRRKKKKPVEQPTESTLEVSDQLPTISAGQTNNQPVNEVPLPTAAAPPPSEPYKPIDMNQLIREEQEKQRQINELLGSNVIPVKTIEELRKPEKIRMVKNSAVEPHPETVYIQVNIKQK